MSYPTGTIDLMPTISRFYGIAIYIYPRDHDPPHYHAIYGEHEGVISIAGGRLVFGSLPNRARRLVLVWHALHGKELSDAWARAAAGESPGRIEPLP